MPGTEIAVPDLGFPSILTARLSAAVVTASGPDQATAERLRHLVPLSGSDVTAQCTLLTRLLLAAPSDDRRLLTALRELVDSLPAG